MPLATEQRGIRSYFLKYCMNFHSFQTLIRNHRHILVISTLILLIGFGVQRKTAAAIAPPIYDALSYIYKGKSVWQEISRGRPFNLLNTKRPPGSVIISYPFGFNDDLHGFLFRLTFAPIVIWVGSFWIAVVAIGRKTIDRWLAASLTFGFASLSMFYHFEWQPGSESGLGWGYVDCLVAALASLAVALVLASANRRSFALALAASFVAAWTLLVKPVGLLLMLVTFGTWIVEVAISNWSVTAWRTDRHLRWYAAKSAVAMIFIMSGTTYLCLTSQYLSPGTWKFFNLALNILRAQTPTSTGSFLMSAINTTMGWHWFLLIALGSLATIGSIFVRVARGRVAPEDFRFLAALLILAVATYWWLFMAGYEERYFFPFVLTFLCVTVPQQLVRASRWPKWAKLGLMFGTATPTLLLIGLLLSEKPYTGLQRLTGVNVSTGQFADEVRIGDWLLKEARRRNRNLRVYQLETDVRTGIVGAMGTYQWILEPRVPGMRFRRPTTWTSFTNLVRIADISSCDFILFTPDQETPEKPDVKVLTWPKESQLFRRWFSTLGENDGISTIASGDIVLLKILDHQKLESAFSVLMRKHQWRDEFSAENSLATQDDLARAYQESGDSKWHVTSANAADLKRVHQVSISPRAEGILLRTSGNHPYFRLPQIAVAKSETLILKLVLTVPKDSLLQIYYTSGPSDRFSDSASLLRNMAKGRNEVYFVVRSNASPLHLRVDVPPAPEDYMIEEIGLKGCISPASN